jgi:hypothetical protein
MKSEFSGTGDFYQPFPPSLVTSATSDDGVAASVAAGTDFEAAIDTGEGL